MQQYQIEVLPTVARAQGMGVIQTVSFSAALSSPYIVYLVIFIFPLFLTVVSSLLVSVSATKNSS